MTSFVKCSDAPFHWYRLQRGRSSHCLLASLTKLYSLCKAHGKLETIFHVSYRRSVCDAYLQLIFQCQQLCHTLVGVKLSTLKTVAVCKLFSRLDIDISPTKIWIEVLFILIVILLISATNCYHHCIYGEMF